MMFVLRSIVVLRRRSRLAVILPRSILPRGGAHLILRTAYVIVNLAAAGLVAAIFIGTILIES
jgi:hypothetical protein